MPSFVDAVHQVWSNRLLPPTVYVEPAWEYKHMVRTLRLEPPPDEAELNALGADGWEMAAAYAEHGHLHVYFKRLAG